MNTYLVQCWHGPIYIEAPCIMSAIEAWKRHVILASLPGTVSFDIQPDSVEMVSGRGVVRWEQQTVAEQAELRTRCEQEPECPF